LRLSISALLLPVKSVGFFQPTHTKLDYKRLCNFPRRLCFSKFENQERRFTKSGYEFQIVAESDDDLLAMLGKLIEKMCHTLGVKHVEGGPHGLQIIDHIVRGYIGCDGSRADRITLLIVDGQEIA
jgi:hypothetical protein